MDLVLKQEPVDHEEYNIEPEMSYQGKISMDSNDRAKFMENHEMKVQPGKQEKEDFDGNHKVINLYIIF